MNAEAARAAQAILDEDRAERAIDTTARDLIGALSGLARDRVLDRAIAAMPTRARVAVRGPVNVGARIFVKQPWRFGRLFLAPDTRPLAGLIRECRQKIDSEVARRAHWTFDLNRLIALRQAMLALRYMRRFGE